MAESRDEMRLEISDGLTLSAHCPPQPISDSAFPGPFLPCHRELPQRSCDETSIHRPSNDNSPLYRPRETDSHHVQGYEGSGYAADAHDDDAPDPADVYEGQPAALHETDPPHAQPCAGTSFCAIAGQRSVLTN